MSKQSLRITTTVYTTVTQISSSRHMSQLIYRKALFKGRVFVLFCCYSEIIGRQLEVALYRVHESFLRALVTGDGAVSDGLPVAVRTNCGLDGGDDHVGW